jgi:acetyltransferase-like isoleucine patch superfamily enzyme
MLAQLVSDDPRIIIGKGSYASSPPTLRPHHSGNRIVIGNYCSIAPNVTIFSGGNHPMNFGTMHPLKLWFGLANYEDWSLDCGDDEEVTVIGSDVWLGYNSIVLGGANIGHGSVIGAGSVVRGIIPPYSIAIGNPAVVVKMRFSEQKIKKLLGLAWWDWSDDQIVASIKNLASTDFDLLAVPTALGNVPNVAAS